jgi:hypothetical protein
MNMQGGGGGGGCSDILRFLGSLSGSFIGVSNNSSINFINNILICLVCWFLALSSNVVNGFLARTVFNTNAVKIKMQGGGAGGGSDILSLLGPLSASLSGVSCRFILTQ